MMGLFTFLWFLFAVISTTWVLSDASDKRGTNIGCLWALVALILFPIGFIAYLFVRNSD